MTEDIVNHPNHYTYSAIEPIDVIDAWELPFTLANTVKYIERYKHKGTPLVDLKKARWYLTHEIEKLERLEHLKAIEEEVKLEKVKHSTIPATPYLVEEEEE